jgi:hypothetical protein
MLISVKISVESKLATYHHVVVVWKEMVIDYESMYKYPLTKDTLRKICGVNSYLQQFAKHYRQIKIFRTGAQQNFTNKGALLGNISIGVNKVR